MDIMDKPLYFFAKKTPGNFRHKWLNNFSYKGKAVIKYIGYYPAAQRCEFYFGSSKNNIYEQAQ